MKLFITGGSGYLGAHVLEALADMEHETLCLLNSTKLARAGVSTLSGDLSEISNLKDEIAVFAPEVFLHLGALSSPRDCELNPELAHEVNVLGTRSLARIAQELGAHFVLLSTDWVFDATPMPAGGYTEDTDPQCETTYGRSKLAAEAAVHELGDTGVILRSALMYGPELHGRRSSLSWLEDGLRGLMSINLIEDEWRTPVFIEDVVKCLISIIERRPAGVFHSAGPERLSRAEFGEQYAKCFDISMSLINRVKRADIDELRNRPEDLSMSNKQTSERLDIEFKSPAEVFSLLKERRASS